MLPMAIELQINPFHSAHQEMHSSQRCDFTGHLSGKIEMSKKSLLPVYPLNSRNTCDFQL